MATPDTAPRRVATNTDLDTATGVPVPGVNPGVYTRKPASADGAPEGKAYDEQRAQAKVDLTPENVDVQTY